MRYLFPKKQRLILRPESSLPAPPPAVLPASKAGEENAFNLWPGALRARGADASEQQGRGFVVGVRRHQPMLFP